MNLSPEQRTTLADEMRVLEEDLCPEIIAAYADELDGDGRHAEAASVREIAEDEALEPLYRVYAALFGLDVAREQPPPESGGDRLYDEWAEIIGLDPEVGRCVTPRTLSDVKACYRPLRPEARRAVPLRGA